MKIFRISILFFLFYFSVSCVSSPVVAMFGKTKFHNSTNFKNTIASNQILKMGESCSYSSYFGNLFILYFGVGGSIDQAREKAGITKIALIDRSSTSVFPLYYEDCILVYGE